MNNCKRIKLSAGDYINLSDIPNEQVFNLVKQCFINAGFNDRKGRYAQWGEQEYWPLIKLTSSEIMYTYECPLSCKRQLSLSDVFNSVNGTFDWDSITTLVDTKRSLFILNCDVSVCVKRIPEHVEAIISPKTSQWWDYENGAAVGLPERSSLVLYEGKEYEVIRATRNDTNDRVVLLCLNTARPNSNRDVFWKNVFDIRPLDYKTPKQIAVDNALKHSSPAETFEEYTERLYDAGLLKGGD